MNIKVFVVWSTTSEMMILLPLYQTKSRFYAFQQRRLAVLLYIYKVLHRALIKMYSHNVFTSFSRHFSASVVFISLQLNVREPILIYRRVK